MIPGLFGPGTIHHPAPGGHWTKSTSAILLLSIITLFSFLGRPGLKEPDEGRYAEIGREMAVSNDWLIPHLNGFEHFQKPPLLYWTTAAAIKVFGPTEWAARLPSAVAAMGVILLTFWIGSRFFGHKTGALAAVILVSSFEFFALGRVLNTDMMLVFWTTASTTCFLRWTMTPQARRWELLSFIAMGLAFLTKGPVAILVPLSVMLALYLHGQWVKAPLPIHWFRGLLVALTIGLSWFLVVVAVHPALLNYFLGFELFQRTVGSARGREQAIWFYFPVILVGTFPWSLFVVCAFFSRCRTCASKKFRRVDLALCLWIAIPLGILTIIRSKLPTYVLPLFPAIALVVADWIGSQATPPTTRRIIVSTAIIGVALLGLPFLLPHLSHQMRDLKPEGALLFIEAIVFGSTALVIGWVARKNGVMSLVYVLSVGAILAWMLGFAELDSLDQVLGEQASVRTIASKLSNDSDPSNSKIFCIGTRAHGIEFYTRHFVYESEDKADLALDPLEDQKDRLIVDNDGWEKNLPLEHPVYLVTTRNESRKLTRQWQELGSSGSYLLLKLNAANYTK